MQPQIQYAKTSDGVRIAYASAGNGPPLLRAGAPGNHIQLDWEGVAVMRPLAKSFQGVWYDGRGGGLSERKATDFSIDAMLRDLSAVVEAVALDRFALVGVGDTVPIAATYAGQNQTRVSHLILIDGWLSATDYQQGFSYEIEEAVRAKSSEAYLEAVARLLFPGSSEAARRFVTEAPMRIDTDVFIASQAAMTIWNAEQFLSQIEAPTLVIGNPNSVWMAPSVPERIAAGIADCRLVFEDPRSERVVPLIEEFILGSTAPAQRAGPLPTGTAIILFADIADSTSLTERIGDAPFRDKARELDTALRAAIIERNGTPVEGKLLGDGVLATFASAKDAIEAALAFEAAGQASGLGLHVGLHAGDVIREDGNVFGGAVNIASRISALAAPGEVLVSDIVRGLARTSAGVSFEERGEHNLKGVSDPVRVFAVRAQEA